MFWPSCSLGPVQACQTDMSWMSFPAILSWLSCSLLSYPSWPVPPCSGRSIICFQSWLSCHSCRVPMSSPAFLSQLSLPSTLLPRYHVHPVMALFASSASLVLSVLCRMPFPLVPCSGCHRTIVLHLMSCPGYTRLSLQNCPMRIDFKN
jgi:hypothetical protein